VLKRRARKPEVTRAEICGGAVVMSPQHIDPVCLLHGKRLSEHVCLYCCLCYRTLTVDECHVRTDGEKEDVCEDCACQEAARGLVPNAYLQQN